MDSVKKYRKEPVSFFEYCFSQNYNDLKQNKFFLSVCDYLKTNTDEVENILYNYNRGVGQTLCSIMIVKYALYKLNLINNVRNTYKLADHSKIHIVHVSDNREQCVHAQNKFLNIGSQFNCSYLGNCKIEINDCVVIHFVTSDVDKLLGLNIFCLVYDKTNDKYGSFDKVLSLETKRFSSFGSDRTMVVFHRK